MGDGEGYGEGGLPLLLESRFDVATIWGRSGIKSRLKAPRPGTAGL